MIMKFVSLTDIWDMIIPMTNMEDKKIGMQEYFDRQSNYHIVFFLSGSWLAMKIVINGWTVYSQTEGDF